MNPSNSPSVSSPSAPLAPVDLVILVALPEEFRELFSFISEGLTTERDPQLTDPIYRFQRQGPATEAPYRCAAMLIGQMGPTQAALAAQRAIQRLNPATIVLIGIAAGIDTDTALGDVVVADVVDGYLENAKAVGDADGRFLLSTSGEPFRTSPQISKSIKHFEFEHEPLHKVWHQDSQNELSTLVSEATKCELQTRKLLKPAPSLYVGHVASGPVVGAASEFIAWLKRRDRKYLALEMEAAGFMAAVHDLNSRASTLVLRGVSDFGDERKQSLDASDSGGFRRYAMRNALRLLWGLLSSGQLPRFEPPTTPDPSKQASSTAQSPSSASPADAAGKDTPPTVHTPQSRNRFFVGRQEALATIREKLMAASHCPTVALTGMGGIGKTQLALEFVYRYVLDERRYQLALWVRADSELTLRRELAELVTPLGLNVGADEEARCLAVRRCLSQRRDWLLILDNVPSSASLDWLRPLLPAQFGGHVVLTSRFPNWSEFAEEVPVPLLPPPDAVALLCKRSGQASGPEAVSASGDLAHALGYLPLALTQAAAYVKSAGKSFAEYLDLFHREQSRLLEQPRPSDYPETVATTWSLSMERARSECPAAAELLRLCAYLSPAPLWTAALRAGASRLSPILAGLGTDEISWDAAVRTLSELALLSAEKGVIWVHQLVQAVTRIRLAPSEQQQYANAALTWSAEMYIFDDADAKTWSQGSAIFPHLMEAIRRGVEQQPRPTSLPFAIYKASNALDNMADLRAAKELLSLASACNFRDHDQRILIQIDCLRARVFLRDGDSRAACELLHKLLKQTDSIGDPNLRAIAESVIQSDMACCYFALGDVNASQSYAHASLRSLEGRQTSEPRQAATVLTTLAVTYSALNQFELARNTQMQALALYDEHAPPPHARYAAVLCNLGEVLMQLGRLSDARDYLLQAWNMSQAVLGVFHPQCAGVLRNLFKVSTHLGLIQEANSAAAWALRIDETVLPDAHPVLADDYSNVGQICLDQQRLDEAHTHLKRALKIAERTYGDHSRVTAIFRAQFGRVLEAKGESAAAVAQLNHARMDLEGDVETTDLAMVLINLATAYAGCQKWELALSSARRGLVIDERLYGPMHPEVAKDLLCLGSLCLASGDHDGAEHNLRRCMKIRQLYMKPEHPQWKEAHLLLAQCLALQGKHSEAAAMWKLLIAAVTRKPQNDSTEARQELIAFHERRAESLEALGEYKTAAGEITTAIETLKRCGYADSQEIKVLNRELTRLRKAQSTVTSKKSGSVRNKKVAKKAK